MTRKHKNESANNVDDGEKKKRESKLGDRCAHLAQLFRVLMQLFQNGESLLLGAVLQNPLDNSAAIGVCGKHEHLHVGLKIRAGQYRSS